MIAFTRLNYMAHKHSRLPWHVKPRNLLNNFLMVSGSLFFASFIVVLLVSVVAVMMVVMMMMVMPIMALVFPTGRVYGIR